MFEDLKSQWKSVKNDSPGCRFRKQFKRRQRQHAGIGRKILFMAIGIIIIAGGIFLLPAPGPGMLVILFGLVLISQESFWMAKVLDKLELVLRKWAARIQQAWKESSLIIKIAIVLAFLLIGAGLAYVAYLIIFG